MSRIPFHPLLVGLLPVVSMYAATPGTSRLEEVLVAAGFALGAAGLLLLAATAAYRDARKAALFASVLLIVFLSFDTIYAFVEDLEVAGVRPGRRRYALPLTYLATAAFAVWLYRLRRPLTVTTGVANMLALGAVLPPAFVLGTTLAATERDAARVPPLDPIEAVAPAVRKPDIYYFVFDRYGDEQVIRAHGLDNTPFYGWLRQRGFYVAGKSRSNYLNTVLSLASSLNASYLDDLARAQGPANSRWGPLYDRIGAHRVGTFLRSQGYQYIHLGSWYWPTRDNPQATRNLNYYVAAPRPLVRLFDSILFSPVQSLLDSPLLDQRRQQWYRTTRQVDDVIRLASERGPKFVFLHLLIPHPPHVFDRNGSYLPLDVESRRSREKNYANQVLAANAMIQRMVDHILAVSPAPPVIILQADEGPYPQGTEASEYEWRRASAALLREKTGILNAYHLPGAGQVQLYPHISPVNSFRVVFNRYFGTNLPLLPDRIYRHVSELQPYDFDEVTDVLRAEAPPSVVRTALP